MSRDYSSRANGDTPRKRRRKPAAKPARSRKPAAKKPAANKRAGRGTPGWVWLISGLCIGLVIAAGYLIMGRPVGKPGLSINIAGVPGEKTPQAGDDDSQGGDNTDDNTAKAKKNEQARFSFYKMLPNYEVVIPGEPGDSNNQPAGGTHAKPQASAPEESAAKTPKIERPGHYIVQAGSFSSYSQADRRKARLALLGLESTIDKVGLDNGKTVYRVRSEPIENLDKLNATLDRLHKQDIGTLVMRRKG